MNGYSPVPALRIAMVPGWQEIASQHAEQITGYVREVLSSGLVFLKSELGIDLGLNPDLITPWVLLLTAWIGLVLVLVVWVSVCRGVSRRLTTDIAKDTPPSKKTDPKADEPKKRSRRRNTEKKAQRNGFAVDPQEDLKLLDTGAPPEVKTDKAKKSKKKQKASVKEQKSSASVDGKEPDEGDWETKISNREKRQQRRKDKTPGDGSASPEATATARGISMMERVQTASEAPETIIKSTAAAPVIQRDVESDRPEIEADYVQDPVIPQVTPCWEEVLSVNDSGWSDLSLQVPPQMTSVQTESWTSMSLSTDRQTAEPSVWPQDMEGSWTIVDGSHIPVSFSGLTAVPDPSWSSQQPCVEVDDEWAGINSASVDPSGDWNAPSDEWSNYVEEQPISTVPAALDQPIPAEPQLDSDVEREKDEASAPASGKTKKKKKKKRKVDEAGPSAQIQTRVEAEREPSTGLQAQDTAGSIIAASAGTRVEAEPPAVSSAPVHTQQRMDTPASTDKLAPVPAHKKAEDSWESPKQVKKKKARRET